MNRKSVFITGKIPQVAYDILSKDFDVTMNNSLRVLSKKEIIQGLIGKDALLSTLSDKIDAEIINSNPNLKIIANYGAGFNNIDLAAANARGIPVTNTPDVSTNATADLTIGLIIAIARRIVEGDKNTRLGNFKGWAPLYHLGTEVTGKTLGIIGFGKIGKAVAKRAKAFEMNVIYFDLNRLSEEIEAELGVKFLSLEELIKASDFLSLNLSYSPETHHLINAERISNMKPTAYLINVARGPLVDERALLEALQKKQIAGAALDVFEFEPEITPGLEQLDNVILTPHLGNATVETRKAMAELAARNILAVLNGEPPLTCVNERDIKYMAAK